MSRQRYLWYAQGFFKKYKSVIAVSTIVGIALVVILPSVLTIVPFGKPTRYIGRVGTFPLSRLPRDIQDLVSYGLTTVGDDGQAQPGLASTFRTEEDRKAYRFTLKPNTVWQDGNVVTPQDVNYNFADIDIVRSANDIVYRLQAGEAQEGAVNSEAFLPASFPTVVSQPLFKQVKTNSLFSRSKTIIYGLGTYTITDITYKGTGIEELTLDSLKDRIVYRFYPTEHDAIIGFMQGQVDILEDMQNLEDLTSWTTIQKHINAKSDQYVGLFFNFGYQNGDDHPYTNKQLRQSLNLALQKPQGADRIFSPIHKKSWAYVSSEDDLDHYEQDMKQAAEDYLKATVFTPLTIELTTIPTYSDQAQHIAKSWEDLGSVAQALCIQEKTTANCDQIGIKVNLRIRNSPDLSDYQVLLIGQQIPQDPDQYSLWHSTQSTNFTHYKNARVDKLLEDGRKATEKEERKLIYQEFQRLLVKESPVIFLQSIKTYRIERKQLL